MAERNNSGKGEGDKIIKIKSPQKTGEGAKVVFYRHPSGEFDLMLAKSMIGSKITVRNVGGQFEISAPKWYLDRAVNEGRERAKTRPPRQDPQPTGPKITVEATKLLKEWHDESTGEVKFQRYLIDDIPVRLPVWKIQVARKRGTDSYMITADQAWLEQEMTEAAEYQMSRENGGDIDEVQLIGFEIIDSKPKNLGVKVDDEGTEITVWVNKDKVEYTSCPEGWMIVGPRWLLEKAIREAREWRAQHPADRNAA